VITGVADRYDPSKRIAAGFFGVEPQLIRQRGGPVAVLGDMWRMTKETGVALADFPVKVFYTAYNLVTGKPRDIYGPMSIVGASRAAGEIAATDRIDAPAKLASMFTVLGSVNLFVALFNFVPLLPLDGGHIAGALYEAAKRGLARLRRRPDPGHVDTAKMLPVAYVVGGVILISGIVLILADLIDPIRLF
jgi:membrane-associated protease RseP (regulator of RpoE activity)